MPTATGTIVTISPTVFQATFVVNDVTYTFGATSMSSFREFASDEVTLKFTDLGQLTGSPAFSCQVGTDNLSIAFSDGITMAGPLTDSRSPEINIFGTGTWSKSKVD